MPPSPEQIRRWEEERETAARLDSIRDEKLRKALARTKKAELIDIMMDLSVYDPSPRWEIEQAVKLEKPMELAVHDTRCAIKIATEVPHEQIGHDFQFSWQAYEAIEFGLRDLIRQGFVEEAMQLAIELMDKGSEQLECSDQGDMLINIEDCLGPVVDAAEHLDAMIAKSWAQQMKTTDRVGFVMEERLDRLLG